MGTGQALVVGASSDIGREIAGMLASEGHDLTLWGRNAGRLSAASREVRALGRGCTAHVVDVTDHTAMREHAARVVTTGDVSVVVWAAGIFDWAPADHADPDAWARVLEVNLTAAAVLTALVAPALVQAAPSALVFIGSGAGRRVYSNNAAYVAAKHGIAGLAGATFLDLRDHGVKVSVIAPGLVAAGAGLGSPPGGNVRRTCSAPRMSPRPSASWSRSLPTAAPPRSSYSLNAPHRAPRSTLVAWMAPSKIHRTRSRCLSASPVATPSPTRVTGRVYRCFNPRRAADSLNNHGLRHSRAGY